MWQMRSGKLKQVKTSCKVFSFSVDCQLWFFHIFLLLVIFSWYFLSFRGCYLDSCWLVSLTVLQEFSWDSFVLAASLAQKPLRKSHYWNSSITGCGKRSQEKWFVSIGSYAILTAFGTCAKSEVFLAPSSALNCVVRTKKRLIWGEEIHTFFCK